MTPLAKILGTLDPNSACAHGETLELNEVVERGSLDGALETV